MHKGTAFHLDGLKALISSDPRVKLVAWLAMSLALLITIKPRVLLILTLFLLLATIPILAHRDKVRPGYGRGLLSMALAGLLFNLAGAAVKHQSLLIGMPEVINLWRLLLLVWAALLFNSMMNPSELVSVVEGALGSRHASAGRLSLIACYALQMLPDIYDYGLELIGSRSLTDGRRRNVRKVLADLPALLADLMVFAFFRADAFAGASGITGRTSDISET